MSVVSAKSDKIFSSATIKKGNPDQGIPYKLAINFFFAAQKRMHEGGVPSGFTTQNMQSKNAYPWRTLIHDLTQKGGLIGIAFINPLAAVV